MAESRNVLELAPTLPRPTVDWSVRELGRRQKHAKLESVQWMENGANGVTGVFARDHVEPEFNHAFETAIIHHQHTEESSVQGPARRRATAAQITVQWTVGGLSGINGAGVRNLVAVGHKPALARAQILPRHMAVKNAAEKVNGHVNVTRSPVQSTVDGASGINGALVLNLVEVEHRTALARA